VLHGRVSERVHIADLVDEAWGGHGAALVLQGQPGVGKSSLLRDAVDRVEGMRVLTTRGIESESPLAFAALQRLLRPLMQMVGRLPAPQASALRAAFGEQEGSGERFLIFLATLSLLAEAAEEGPVLCVVDDAHWLDDASAAALLFVARRLGSERVALLFATREADVRRFEFGDLPQLAIAGLDPEAAHALLAEQADETVAESVRVRLLEQTDGNPLALMELPRALSAEQLRGTAPLPPQLPLTADVQRVFLDRSRHLSSDAQTLLLVAATDDSARLSVIRSALTTLSVDCDAAMDEVEASGLLRVDAGVVEFRHPLVRSAVHQGAPSRARRAAHAALAAVLTDADADRRAWHRAASVDEPDAAVVDDLEQAAERAMRRGGYEAASAALERAAELTLDDAAQARLLLGAATNSWLAGQLARSRALADAGRRLASDAVVVCDLDRLRGRLEFNIGSVAVAVRTWSQAARAVARADPGRARELGMISAAASTFMAPADRTDLTPAELPLDTPSDDARQQCFATLFTGFHLLLAGDLAHAATTLRSALEIGRSLDETDLLTNMGIAAFHLGDDEAFRSAFTRQLTRSRGAGAMGLVLFALPRLALAELSSGRWGDATSNAAEALELARSTGQTALTAMPLAELALHAALRGEADYDERLRQLDQVMADERTGILGELVHDSRRWATAVHALVGGQPNAALVSLERMTQAPLTRLAAYDRLESAVRAGRRDLAEEWLRDLAGFADAVNTPRAHAVVAYGRALLAQPASAETFFGAALEHQAEANRPFENARIQLGLGEFLRRARRRVDARDPLRRAINTFDDLGAAPWADRARTELRASGESARKRDDSVVPTLTAQERQVARQVAQGMTNREVAAQLFLSPRTVDFHLRNVFAKTGISSRGELVRLELG
jgi:DNA-binding CsgD family transcriptional regulator